jgi:hypothetical protein
MTWDVQSLWHDLAEAEHSLDRGGETYGERLYDSFGRAVHDFAGWTGIDEQVSRVERIREALADSGPLAQRRIVQVLSGIELSTIWHILIKAAEDIALYFGGSVVAGTLIGGVVGAFFGGIGAVPGGAMGATAGAKVGGWILAFLGLKSLVVGLSDALPRAVTYYETGFREAWGPTHHDDGFCVADGHGCVNRAAHDIAEGHVELIAALLAALVAYLTRGKGDRGAILQEIRQSPRLGPKVADWIAANEEKLRNHPRLKPGEKPSVAMMVAEDNTAKGGGSQAAGRKAKTARQENKRDTSETKASEEEEIKAKVKPTANPSSLLKDGTIDHRELSTWAEDQGLQNQWNAAPDKFPSGGFKYQATDGEFEYSVHGHGPNPVAMENFPTSNSALGPTVSVTRTPVGGGFSARENLMQSGEWAPFSTNPNAAHIPLLNSPF